MKLQLAKSTRVAVALVALTVNAAQQTALAQAYSLPALNPKTFAPAVTNPYFPLVPGTSYRFRGTGDSRDETTVITVMRETRTVMGIRATIVRDQVFEGKELVEDTYDWYAQDAEGNVWYLGEDTREYRSGRIVSTKGSWEAGLGGALAGIIMWADPSAHINEPYRQEYLRGVAEDMGKVLSTTAAVTIPFGKYQRCVEIEDTTPLEPAVSERKFYCLGVGLVKETGKGGGAELVSTTKP